MRTAFNRNMSMVGLSVVGLCLLMLTISQAFADKNIVTQTFDITPTSCDGLQLAGVTYSFTVVGTPNLDCMAGLGGIAGPGNTNSIQGAFIVGTAAGVLHLTFDVPTTSFSFGVAQSTLTSPQSVAIDLNRPGVGLLRQEVALTTTNDPYWVGGRFDYDGPAIKTATISFPMGPYTRFAVDNVSYFRPPGREK